MKLCVAARHAAAMLAGLLLASCMPHGQELSRPAQPGLSHLPHWKVFRNYSSHSSNFFRRLTFGRAFVHESARTPGIVRGEFVRADGRTLLCYSSEQTGGNYRLQQAEMSWETRLSGAARTIRFRGKTYRSLMFYEPKTGAIRLEYLEAHADPQKRRWIKAPSGWIQDSVPRVLVDACPGVTLFGMRINEKQTSRYLDELRRQDPEAPIRNFPGSQYTGPGRTGLAASGGRPTTTREEIEAFVKAQAGSILLSARGDGYVFTEGWTDKTEIWRLDYDGDLDGAAEMTTATDSTGQEWWISRLPGVGTVRYPINYPFPLLPTGYRHAAFQLTDRLIEAGEPVVLPWMPAEWKDFVFRADGTVLARRTDHGPDRVAPWLWTEGRLRIQFGGNVEAPFWTEVADRLGMQRPAPWTLADGEVVG